MGYSLGTVRVSCLGANASLAELQQQRDKLKTQLDSLYRERYLLAGRLRAASTKTTWGITVQLIPEAVLKFIEGGPATLPAWVRSALSAVAPGLLADIERVLAQVNQLQTKLQSIEDAIAGYKEVPVAPPLPDLPPPLPDLPPMPMPGTTMLSPYIREQTYILPSTIAVDKTKLQIQPLKETPPPTKPLPTPPPPKTWLEKKFGKYWWAPPVAIVVVTGGVIAYKKKKSR